MDQLAGVVAFVADRGGLRGPDYLPGQRVTLPQVGHAVAAQDAADGAGRHPQLGAEPVLASAFLVPLGDDRFLDLDRSLSRTVMRARRAVLQAGFAFGPKPVDPAVGALTGDALGLRGVGDRPALFADPLDE